jgi:16S rRNA (cytosine967-C5)-methyltransferase
LRRNPDLKWRQSPQSVQEMAVLQAAILQSASRLLKVGGRLVYATCSILPAENQLQVQAFIKANPEEWALEDEFTLWPHRDGFDGFYAARLIRKEKAQVA